MTGKSSNEKDNQIEKKLCSQICSHQEKEDKHFKFDIPLYIQRYEYISKLLSEFKCKTYLDIGCAECNLIRFAKNFDKRGVGVVFGIDLDENLLTNSKYILHPFPLEFVRKREEPLEIYLMSGDISEMPISLLNLLDKSALDFVSLVEVIEHMYPDCLKKTVEVVFEKLKPLIVAITTPNGEFNVVFDDINNDNNIININGDDYDKNVSAPKKFRHYDHKFEWTRKEFESWCLNILENYKDTYEKCIFDGLGDAPENFQHVGKCTQIAVFYNKSISDMNHNYVETKLKDHLIMLQKTQYPHTLKPFINKTILENTSYKLVDFIQFPYELELESEKAEKISLEINWLIMFLTKPYFKHFETASTNPDPESLLSKEKIQEYKENDLDVYDEDIKLISINHLLEYPSLRKYNLTKLDIIKVIESENKYKLSKSGQYIIYRTPENDSLRSLNDDDDHYNEERHAKSSKTNLTLPENSSIILEEDWSNEAIDLKPTNRKVTNPDLQFEDAEEQSTVNVIYTDDFRLLIDLNALETPNNYYYNESKLFSQKLRSIRKRNRSELKKFDSNVNKEQFEDNWE